MKSWRILIPLLLPLLFSNCRTLTGSKPQVKVNDGRVPSEVRAEDVAAVDAWKQQGNKGGFYPAANTLKAPITPHNTGFVVDLDAQRAYLYQGSELIAYAPIASGRKYYRTETGDYTIGEKELNHHSTSYGSFVNSKGGTVMSEVENGYDPTPVGARFEGALMKFFMRLHHNGSPTAMGFHRGILPGYPASHGCIRLPGSMAEWFYGHIAPGTPVAVRGSRNGIPYGHSQGRPKRAPRIHSSLKEKPKTETPPAVTPDAGTPAPEPVPGPGAVPSGDPAATPAPGSN